MADFASNLRRLRKQKDLTQTQLGQMLGIACSTVSMYERGEREPDWETMESIADFFNISLDDLYGKKYPIPNMEAPKTMIPILGYVRAGIPIEAVEEILDYEEISEEMARQGEFFALSIKGDSMEPRIKEGDVVIIRKQEQVDNGDLAVILVNGNDATVKKFFKTEMGIRLVSFNPTYDVFFFSPEEAESLPVRVIGKVVELRAKF